MWFSHKPIAPQRPLGPDPADSRWEIADLHKRFNNVYCQLACLNSRAHEQYLQLRALRRSSGKYVP